MLLMGPLLTVPLWIAETVRTSQREIRKGVRGELLLFWERLCMHHSLALAALGSSLRHLVLACHGWVHFCVATLQTSIESS